MLVNMVVSIGYEDLIMFYSIVTTKISYPYLKCNIARENLNIFFSD